MLIQRVRIYIFKNVLIFLTLALDEISKLIIFRCMYIVINFINLIKRISLKNEFHYTSILIIKEDLLEILNEIYVQSKWI